MQFTTLALAFAGAAAVSAQAVTSAITPTGSAPAGCTGTVDGSFEITVYNTSAPAKRDLSKRAECGGEGTLVITLKDGILMDNKARTGYIASNWQFQFDGPPQADAKLTAGFSSCSNSSLALGSSEVFYRCRSGSFYNLYNKNWAPQCEAVAIGIVPCGGSTSSPSAAPAPSAPSAPSAPAPVSATTAAAPTSAAPVSTLIPTTTAAPVSQYTDGQIEVPTTVAPIAQITDGQIQATASAPSAPVSSSPAASTSPIAPAPASGSGNLLSVSSAAVALFAGLSAAALL